MCKCSKELFHVSFSLPVSSLCWPLNRSHSLLLSTYSTQPAHFKLTAPQSPSPFSPPHFSPPPHQSASTHQHSRAAGFSLAAHFAPDGFLHTKMPKRCLIKSQFSLLLVRATVCPAMFGACCEISSNLPTCQKEDCNRIPNIDTKQIAFSIFPLCVNQCKVRWCSSEVVIFAGGGLLWFCPTFTIINSWHFFQAIINNGPWPLENGKLLIRWCKMSGP